jgi:hypothetical protein
MGEVEPEIDLYKGEYRESTDVVPPRHQVLVNRTDVRPGTALGLLNEGTKPCTPGTDEALLTGLWDASRGALPESKVNAQKRVQSIRHCLTGGRFRP